MILFGGPDAEGQAKDDTWAYDPAANTWTELKPTGAVPSAALLVAAWSTPRRAAR